MMNYCVLRVISTLSRPQFVLAAAALGFVCKLIQISGNAHANTRLPVCEWSAGHQQIFYRLTTKLRSLLAYWFSSVLTTDVNIPGPGYLRDLPRFLRWPSQWSM